MRPLNKQAEQKLIAAIENAANRVNAGATPNEAIIKSASEAEIPAGHINLMVHAYNTGRTTKQREQGEDTLEKSADFQLADIHVVTEALYPKQVKTSGEIVRNSIVSTEYAVPPSGFLARRRSALDKTAAAQVALPAKTYVAPPRDAHAEAMRAHSEKTAIKHAEEESRRVVTATYNKAAAALEELNTYFRTPGNMSFQDAVTEVGLRLGDTGVSVLQKIAAVYPHFEKQAATKLQHFGDNPIYTLVTDVIGSVEAYNGANEAHSSKKANAVSQKAAQQFLTGSILNNPADEPVILKSAAPSDKPFKPTLMDPMAPVRTVGGILRDPMAQVFGESDKPPGAVKKIYDELQDPAHEMAMHKIRTNGVLHDLMLNDPAISGHDPAEIAEAFNSITDLAPQFADSPGLMGSVLRKRLESGGLADFDVKQLLEMDKLRADRDKAIAEVKQINDNQAIAGG